jgi:hypothetical protein
VKFFPVILLSLHSLAKLLPSMSTFFCE